jgi:hypothetical protein
MASEGLAVTRILVALCALTLAGCGIAAKVDARTNYQKSVEDYRACLDANANNLRACDGKRLAMEAEERAYNNMSAGITDHGNSTSNIIVQGR